MELDPQSLAKLIKASFGEVIAQSNYIITTFGEATA